MSYSLKLVDGDLSQKGSTLEIVTGVNKLQQDLDLWLRERYGGDRFHPNMGSTLQEYIGGVADETSRRDVQDEVLRVLQNYQDLQLRTLRERPQFLSYSEMLMSIEEVKAAVNYDTVTVSIRVRNGVNETRTIIAGASA